MTRDIIKQVALASLAGVTLLGLTSPTLAQNRVARERITALSSSEAVERAMAACELGRMRAGDVLPARDALLALIGDNSPVESKLCRDWESWQLRDDASSPGREAAMALKWLGTDVLPQLIELLHDSRIAAREQAAFALGLIESEMAVEPLALVLGDAEARVRSRAAWSLGMIESVRGVEPLTLVLRDDPEAEVRKQAAWALGTIKAVRGVEGLAAGATDGDPHVRKQVAWAVGMIKSAGGIAPLQRLLRDDDDAVRAQAAWAMGMINDIGAVESLVQALTDRSTHVREQVAWALGMIESMSAAEAIADALERETDQRVRRQLIWALTRVIDSANLQD